LLVAGTASAATTVVLSGSRASLLAVVVVIAIQVFVRRRELFKTSAGVLAGILVLSLLLPQVRDRLSDARTITGRRLLWQQAGRVGLDRWWAGAPSSFIDAVGKYRNADWVREVGTRNPPDSPHNWLLQALDAGGVPLLVIAVALAVVLVATGWRVVRRDVDALSIGTFTAMVGYGLALLPNFTIAGSTCLAAFLVGCLIGDEASRKERTVQLRATAAVAVAATVVFACGAFAERDLETGIVAARGGDISAAHRAFESAHRLRPFDGDVAMLASQALAGAANDRVPGAAHETIYWARLSLRRTPDTYASALALAVAEVSEGDLDAARTGLDRLIRLYPTEPGALIQRGIVRFGERDVPGARRDLRYAQSLDPTDRTPTRILRKIAQQLR
jgi:Flp pilus assembly protein TadD